MKIYYVKNENRSSKYLHHSDIFLARKIKVKKRVFFSYRVFNFDARNIPPIVSWIDGLKQNIRGYDEMQVDLILLVLILKMIK